MDRKTPRKGPQAENELTDTYFGKDGDKVILYRLDTCDAGLPSKLSETRHPRNMTN